MLKARLPKFCERATPAPVAVHTALQHALHLTLVLSAWMCVSELLHQLSDQIWSRHKGCSHCTRTALHICQCLQMKSLTQDPTGLHPDAHIQAVQGSTSADDSLQPAAPSIDTLDSNAVLLPTVSTQLVPTPAVNLNSIPDTTMLDPTRAAATSPESRLRASKAGLAQQPGIEEQSPAEARPARESTTPEISDRHQYPASFTAQLRALLWRQSVRNIRNPTEAGAKLIAAVVIAVLIGIIFLDLPTGSAIVNY